MNAPANINDPMPVDRFDPAAMRKLRLLPMACVVEGYIVWCRGTDALAISRPQKHVAAPLAADTACLSIIDYRRVTRAIADQEAL
jgi:hypothetical protein